MSFDWQRAFRAGADLARDDRRLGDTPEAIMWVLLRDAFRVSRFFAGTPYLGYPSKSSMPEAPDEITVWQQISAYLRGEVDELPEYEPSPVRPSAEECTRADHVLRLFHSVTSAWGTNSTRRKSVAALAMGMRKRTVTSRYGLTRRQIDLARDAALRGMVAKLPEFGTGNNS